MIRDDNPAPRTLSLTSHVDVLSTNEIPGVLLQYFPTSAGGASALLDQVPQNPSYSEVRDTFLVAGSSRIGNSPFTTNTMVRFTGFVELGADDTYEFVATGGVDRRLEVNGNAVSGAP